MENYSLRAVGLLPAHLVNPAVELITLSTCVASSCQEGPGGGGGKQRDWPARATLGRIPPHWAWQPLVPQGRATLSPRGHPQGPFLQVTLSRDGPHGRAPTV